MKSLLFGLAISLFPLISAAAVSRPHLVTTVTAASPTKSDGIVQVTIANDGDANAYVFVNQLPQAGKDGLTNNTRFTVTDAEGRKASYIGRNDNILVTAKNYHSIVPGQKLTFEVNIPRNYRVAPGLAKIVFGPIEYETEPMTSNRKNIFFTKASAPIEVWLKTDAIPASAFVPNAQLNMAPRTVMDCPASFSVASLLSSAKDLEESAWTTVKNNSMIDGSGNVSFKPDARWAKWFGSSDPASVNGSLANGTVRAYGRVLSIHWGLSTQLGAGSPPQVRCDDCSGNSPGTIAHVQYPGINTGIEPGGLHRRHRLAVPQLFRASTRRKPHVASIRSPP